MMELRKTAEFLRWLDGLQDLQALGRIQMRLDRLADGLFGDSKQLEGGIFELRIHSGPGYRLYGTRRGRTLIIMIGGGDKSSQDKDIRQAIKLARTL